MSLTHPTSETMTMLQLHTDKEIIHHSLKQLQVREKKRTQGIIGTRATVSRRRN
jgi:hypothetical protein